jgi:hypothetical protein
VSQQSGGPPPYRVVYSGQVREHTKRLLQRASLIGRFAELAQCVQGIHTRLEWIPLDFGEPIRDFPQLGIRVYTGTVPPLVVTYGVDEARRIVTLPSPSNSSRAPDYSPDPSSPVTVCAVT